MTVLIFRLTSFIRVKADSVNQLKLKSEKENFTGYQHRHISDPLYHCRKPTQSLMEPKSNPKRQHLSCDLYICHNEKFRFMRKMYRLKMWFAIPEFYCG